MQASGSLTTAVSHYRFQSVRSAVTAPISAPLPRRSVEHTCVWNITKRTMVRILRLYQSRAGARTHINRCPFWNVAPQDSQLQERPRLKYDTGSRQSAFIGTVHCHSDPDLSDTEMVIEIVTPACVEQTIPSLSVASLKDVEAVACDDHGDPRPQMASSSPERLS